MATPNGYFVEILEDIASAVAVPPAHSANRMDYLALMSEEHSASIQYLIGEESDDVLDQMPKVLRSGVLLAKVYVTYPTLSRDSVYIYRAMPSKGEQFLQAIRPTTLSDWVATDFIFPVRCAAGYAMKIKVYGVIQTEVEDYQILSYGSESTTVRFNEQIPPGADIIADVYAGLINVPVHNDPG